MSGGATKTTSTTTGQNKRSGTVANSATEDTTHDPARQLTLDEIFEALKNERRRRVIHYLGEEGGRLELGQLAERIAADENEKSISDVTYDERKRVYVALYQCHLPKLDDLGIISFNKSRGTMTLEDEAEQLLPYLGQANGRPWYKYYASIVTVGIAALAGIVLLGGSPEIVQFTLLAALVAIAGCALVHARSVRSTVQPE